MIEKTIEIKDEKWILKEPSGSHLPLAMNIYVKMLDSMGNKVNIDEVSEDVGQFLDSETAKKLILNMYSDESVELTYYMVKDKPMKYNFTNLDEFKEQVPMSIIISLIGETVKIINEAMSDVGGETQKN